MTIIKVAEVKISDEPKTVKLELTKDEALMALTCAEMVRERYAQEVARPCLRTRRAIKRGDTTEKSLREHHRTAKSLQDKLGAAIIGADADKLEAAIAAIKEGK